jgi:hypothetical protein
MNELQARYFNYSIILYPRKDDLDMPLNLFNHRKPHKITAQTSKPVKNADIATTIVAGKKRLSTYDISCELLVPR